MERQVNSANPPILEGLLPEGARVEVVLREVAANGDAFTIRKFRGVPYTVVDLIGLETAGPDALAYLWMALDKERNVVIVGPTGGREDDSTQRAPLPVEARREDNHHRGHEGAEAAPRAVAPPPTGQAGAGGGEGGDRHDGAVEGGHEDEARLPDTGGGGEGGEEAYVLFQAFASGHHGLTTIHADNAEGAVRRFVTKPMDVPTALLGGMAHVYVSVRRVRTGAGVRRSVWEVKEYLDYTDRPVFTDLLINGKWMHPRAPWWARTSSMSWGGGGAACCGRRLGMGSTTTGPCSR